MWSGLLRMALCRNCEARLSRRLDTDRKALRRILHRLKEGKPVVL